MSLSLQNDQKQHLSYFVNQPEKVLKTILQNISNVKSLNDDQSEPAQATRALLKLLIDARKLRLSEKDFFTQTRSQTELTDDMVNVLSIFLGKESDAIDDLITKDEFSFRDLEWRLETKVASRFLHSHPPDPKVVMKLHLDKESSLKHRLTLSEASQETTKKELIVETDVNSLVHIIDQLELARTAVNVKKASQVTQ